MMEKMELFKRHIDEAMHGRDEALEKLKQNVVLSGNLGVMQRKNVYIVYTKLKKLGDIKFKKMFSDTYCENSSNICYYVESLNITDYQAKDSVLNGKFEIFVTHTIAPLKLEQGSDIVIFVERKIDIFVVTDYGCFNILSKDLNIDIMGAIYECFKKANIVLYPSYKSNFLKRYEEHLTNFLEINISEKEKKILSAKLDFIPKKGHINQETDYVDVYINDMFFTTVPYEYTINAKFVIGDEKECQQVVFDSIISIFGLRTQIDVNFLINNLLKDFDEVSYEEQEERQNYLFGKTGNIYDIKTDAYKLHKNINRVKQLALDDIILRNFGGRVLSKDDFKLYVDKDEDMYNGKFLLDESDYSMFNSDEIYLYEQKIFVNNEQVYRQSTVLVKYEDDVYIISLKEILRQIYDEYYEQSFPIFGFSLIGRRFATIEVTDNFAEYYNISFPSEKINKDIIKELIYQNFDDIIFFPKDGICNIPKTVVKELYKNNMEFKKDTFSCIPPLKTYYQDEEKHLLLCRENANFKKLDMNNIKLAFLEGEKHVRMYEFIDSNSMLVYASIKRTLIKKIDVVHWFKQRLE